ncbi:cupin domain-containing protein [Flavobacteriaceae bacterium AU392]|nr:cupin domain-containing protein [Flavobacteriaceae bacterium AU392]
MKQFIYIGIYILFFINVGFAQEKIEVTVFQLDSLMTELNENGRSWKTVLKNKDILTGLYILKAGTKDEQSPHKTNEVYYVVKGKGKFTAANKIQDVAEGSILFIKANVDHHFFDI